MRRGMIYGFRGGVRRTGHFLKVEQRGDVNGDVFLVEGIRG